MTQERQNLLQLIGHSPLSWESRPGTQDKNLEEETEAKNIWEFSLLACSQAHTHLTFLQSPGLLPTVG